MPRCPSSFWRVVAIFLAALAIVQWILFSVVINRRHDPWMSASAAGARFVTPSTISTVTDKQQSSTASSGVAVTLMLKAPKWFARRYTIMLHNVISNTPENWRVQVFVNKAWLEKDVLPLHPGLQRMYGDKPEPSTTSWTIGRVTWTPLPVAMTKMRPKEIMKSSWLWTNVLEENVLLFGGNGALCANGRSTIEDFLQHDYVGTPSNQHHGKGGDGSTHSFRHRSAMLSILEKYPAVDDSLDYQYFLKYLLQDNFKVADREMTHLFGGFSEIDEAPFLLSGTQATMNHSMRENLLSVCPEVKVIFPSMHEPACFGAHPDGPKCKESICALKDVLPPQGC